LEVLDQSLEELLQEMELKHFVKERSRWFIDKQDILNILSIDDQQGTIKKEKVADCKIYLEKLSTEEYAMHFNTSNWPFDDYLSGCSGLLYLINLLYRGQLEKIVEINESEFRWIIRIADNAVKGLVQLTQLWINATRDDYLFQLYEQLDPPTISLPWWYDAEDFTFGHHWTLIKEAREVAEKEGRVHEWPNKLPPLYPRILPGAVSRTFPYPLALGYSKLIGEKEGTPLSYQYDRILEFSERLIIMISIICLMTHVKDISAKRQLDIRRNLRRPTLGNWISIIWKISSSDSILGKSRNFDTLFSEPALKAIRMLSVERNRESHPRRILPDGVLKDRVFALMRLIDLVMFAVGHLFLDMELVIPESYKGKVYLRKLKGLETSLSMYSPLVTSDLTPWIETPCLFYEDEIIPLYPLMVWQECDQCNMFEFFYWNGFPVEDDGICEEGRFVSFTTHHELSSPDLSREIVDFGIIRK